MKICLYLENYACGGIEAFLNGLAREADKKGRDIRIAAGHISSKGNTAGKEREIIQCRGMVGFYRLCKKEQYRAVHINAYKGTTLKLLVAAYLAGVPVRIAHSHNSDLRPGILRSVKLLIHKAAAGFFGLFATRRLACSAPAARFMFGKRAYEFIPNGIDIRAFEFNKDLRLKTRRELGAGSKTLLVGCIGRLCTQKNQAFLLRVLAGMEDDKKLIIIGDGEDRKFLRREAIRLKVRDRVLFTGNRNDIHALLCAMDVFALPSLFEGLPVTAVEAQAAGVPCVLSDRITRECRLSELCSFLPLEEETWLRAIEAFAFKRGGGLAAKEYDMSNVYRCLERIYAGE